MMISTMTVPHLVYWCFTLLASPILAYIGAQISYLIFSKKIEANRAAYRKWEMKQRKLRKKKQARKR